MNHGSLFSGIGGFDLAAQWMNWDNIFHCEWNPFGQKILKRYWPNAISYEDITKTDFTIHRGSIDILTGGFPCQPYSLAGQRKGKEDERHLWPEMFRAIREIQPRWVVGENVRGLINWSDGMVFDEVQADLEDAGYEVMPFLLPAAGVNAPHRRDRIWFVAYSGNNGNTGNTGKISGETEKKNGRGEESGTASQQQIQLPDITNPLFGDVADTEGKGRREFTSENQGGKDRRSDNYGEIQYASDTNSWGLEGSKEVGRNGKYAIGKSINGNASDTDSKMLEYRNGEGEANRRTEQEKQIESFNSATEWEAFPTQSPVCGGDDGLPTKLDGITFPKWRNESIKGYGNAIVPQVVLQIFKAIKQYEDHE
jgi:DNA (cytosine-5)-methyltransferase 1